MTDAPLPVVSPPSRMPSGTADVWGVLLGAADAALVETGDPGVRLYSTGRTTCRWSATPGGTTIDNKSDKMS